jgi:pSer/pThr/pTyr-binding forkhead associated (FHA) protein
MNSWRLFTVHGPNTGKTIHLDKPIQFGREPENDIPIPDGQVSRAHARIEPIDKGYTLTDLDSTNGTFVNDKPIENTVQLRVGDTIMIGPARFLVLAGVSGD